mgnify:CR=1 FL=1
MTISKWQSWKATRAMTKAWRQTVVTGCETKETPTGRENITNGKTCGNGPAEKPGNALLVKFCKVILLHCKQQQRQATMKNRSSNPLPMISILDETTILIQRQFANQLTLRFVSTLTLFLRYGNRRRGFVQPAETTEHAKIQRQVLRTGEERWRSMFCLPI